MWDAAFSLLLFVDGKNFGPATRNLLRRDVETVLM